jgi:hypothetical protein
MRRALLAFLASLAVAAPAAMIVSDPPATVRRVASVPDQPEYSLEGLAVPLTMIGRQGAAVVAAERAEKARLAREAEARRRAQQRAVQPVSRQVTGTCAEMKPAGFPDSIIWRESRGDPNAHNPSGAHGCAQIMPFHFSRGSCVGLSYAECWAKLWAGGAGASHWACTVESGCAG